MTVFQNHSIFIGTSVSSTKDCLLSGTASYLFCLSKFPPLSLTNQMPENKNTYQLNKTYISLQNVICLVCFVKLNAWKLKYFVCFVWFLYADNAFCALFFLFSAKGVVNVADYAHLIACVVSVSQACAGFGAKNEERESKPARKSRSSVSLCSETKRNRLLRRPLTWH